MTEQREVHVGYDSSVDLPNTWRVFVECDDDITELIMVNPTPWLKAMFLIPQDEAAESEAYRQLVDEHLERCSTCKAWFVLP